VNESLWAHSVHQIASYLQEFIPLLPPDTTPGFPSRVCLLGNLVDAAEPAVSRSDSSIKLVKSIALHPDLELSCDLCCVWHSYVGSFCGETSFYAIFFLA
jgi:hypothetical protein